MEETCAELSEESRTKLAVWFMNCHLQKSGLDTYDCGSQDSVRKCTSAIAENQLAFNAYTEFFLHIDHICYFLQSEVFQVKTDQAVHSLQGSTVAAANALEALSNNAQQVSLDMCVYPPLRSPSRP